METRFHQKLCSVFNIYFYSVIGVHNQAHKCGGQRKIPGTFLYLSPIYFFETESLTEPKVLCVNLSCMVSKLPASPCIHPASLGLQVLWSCLFCFVLFGSVFVCFWCECWEMEFRFSLFVQLTGPMSPATLSVLKAKTPKRKKSHKQTFRVWI